MNTIKVALMLFVLMIMSNFMAPEVARAHGDPRVLFSMLTIAILDVVGLGFILLSKVWSKVRIQSLFLYIVSVSSAWLWGLEYTGLEPFEMYLKLFLPPLLTFGFLLWLCKKANQI